MAPPAHGTAGDTELVAALAESQRLGMLGDRPIAEVIEHAAAFVAALADVTGTVIDLGSGGGVPGLVIARARQDLRLVLVDRRARRTDHLRRLVGRLGVADRVEVLTIEAASLRDRWAGTADAVVARSFGPPPSTLRAAAPILRSDGVGVIVVSEPPRGEADRWPRALLEELGLVAAIHGDRRVAVFLRAPCAQREGSPSIGRGPVHRSPSCSSTDEGPTRRALRSRSDRATAPADRGGLRRGPSTGNSFALRGCRDRRACCRGTGPSTTRRSARGACACEG